MKTSCFGIDYYDLAETDLRGFHTEKAVDKVLNTGLLIVFPTLLGIISALFYRPVTPTDNPLTNSIIISVTLLTVSSVLIAIGKHASDSIFFRKLVYIFGIQFLCFFSWTFLIILPITIGITDGKSDLSHLLMAGLALALTTLMMYPFGSQKNTNTHIERHIGTILVAVIFSIASLMQPISSYIGKSTLKFFSVGGEVKQSIYFPEEELKYAPKILTSYVTSYHLKSAEEDSSEGKKHEGEEIKYAFSKDATLLFKNGDYSYFKKEGFVFKLNTKNLIIISQK